MYHPLSMHDSDTSAALVSARGDVSAAVRPHSPLLERGRNRGLAALGRVLDIPFCLVAVGYFGICAAYSATVPMWDSRIYFDALMTAATSPFSISNFNVAGHPTAAYFLFLSLPQYIDPGGVAPTIL